MSRLPPEILYNIFSFLDGRDELSCALINKHWASIAIDAIWSGHSVDVFSARFRNCVSAIPTASRQQYTSRIQRLHVNDFWRSNDDNITPKVCDFVEGLEFPAIQEMRGGVISGLPVPPRRFTLVENDQSIRLEQLILGLITPRMSTLMWCGDTAQSPEVSFAKIPESNQIKSLHLVQQTICSIALAILPKLPHLRKICWSADLDTLELRSEFTPLFKMLTTFASLDFVSIGSGAGPNIVDLQSCTNETKINASRIEIRGFLFARIPKVLSWFDWNACQSVTIEISLYDGNFPEDSKLDPLFSFEGQSQLKDLLIIHHSRRSRVRFPNLLLANIGGCHPCLRTLYFTFGKIDNAAIARCITDAEVEQFSKEVPQLEEFWLETEARNSMLSVNSVLSMGNNCRNLRIFRFHGGQDITELRFQDKLKRRVAPGYCLFPQLRQYRFISSVPAASVRAQEIKMTLPPPPRTRANAGEIEHFLHFLQEHFPKIHHIERYTTSYHPSGRGFVSFTDEIKGDMKATPLDEFISPYCYYRKYESTGAKNPYSIAE